MNRDNQGRAISERQNRDEKKTPHCGVFSEIGRRERIRTSDPLVPNQLRYQAALLADFLLVTLHGLATYVHVNLNKIYMFVWCEGRDLNPHVRKDTNT